MTVPYLVLIDGSQTIDLNGTREMLVATGCRIPALLGARSGAPLVAEV